MKLETVAECVESDAIRKAISELGVSYGQGFSIGRPVPLDKVLAGLTGANIGSREPQTVQPK
jgi:EAL domain-containing protein (putative c-di-GMP-specific phosphodiesterase class I)